MISGNFYDISTLSLSLSSHLNSKTAIICFGQTISTLSCSINVRSCKYRNDYRLFVDGFQFYVYAPNTNQINPKIHMLRNLNNDVVDWTDDDLLQNLMSADENEANCWIHSCGRRYSIVSNSIRKYHKRNLIGINFISKVCKVLHIGNAPYTGNYSIAGTQLELLDEIRDLGIQIDSRLKFHSHTDIVVKNAYRILGLICKSFECRDSDVMVKLYKTLVRPILEYNNVIWGPSYTLDNQKLEREQLE